MRAFKLLGFIIGGLVALVALAAVAVLVLVDPNDFKDRIAAAGEAATGRRFTVRGNIELKLFPQLALSVEDASLGNPEGFGDAPFATVHRVALRVAVMPLLRKELEVGRIEIDGLDLRLERNGDGKGNWEDFGQKEGSDNETRAEAGPGSTDLEGLRITNSRVQIDGTVIDRLDVDVGRLSLGAHHRLESLVLKGELQPKGAPAPLPWLFKASALDLDRATQQLAKTRFEAQLGLAKLSGELSGRQFLDAPSFEGQLHVEPLALRDWMQQLGAKPPESLPSRLGGRLAYAVDLKDKRYRFTDLALEGQTGTGASPLAWSFGSPALELDLAGGKLKDTAFTAKLGAAELSGRIAGEGLPDAPAVWGSVTLKPVALRGLMTQFGLTPPVTRDEKVLSRFALSGRYAYGGGRLQADGLDLRLDDTRMQGRLGLDTASGAKTFDLNIDRIDVDRYLPPSTTADTSKKAPFELPVATLKTLHAKGSMSVGSLKVSGVTLTAVQLGVDARDGLTLLSPIKARLYDGQYAGTVRMDARSATPVMALDHSLNGIDVAALLNEFAKTKRLSGRGTIAMNVTAQGSGGDALMKTLRGTASANLTGGAVEGVDLWYGIAQAQSLLQQRSLSATPNTKRTTFETFKASADIVEGVAMTKDLAIVSQQLRVTGQGSTNLVTQALDYALEVTILKSPAAEEAALSQYTLATIPVKVSGSFEDPKVRPDFAGMAKARLQKEVDKRKDELKEKAQEKVQGVLKGLFGR
ncbi:MAG: hypothetical protein RLZZ200_2689 [Pseudomonadota bacterium]|jgi:AsmA protein